LNQQSIAFELVWDPSHLGDDNFDATLVPFDGSDRIAGWITARPITVPERIFFEANVETLKTIDFPINDRNWPIMSRRMIAALEGVGDFAHRLIPVIMLDDTVPTKARLDAGGNPRPGVAVEGFAAVQITHYTDAFDWERSEYVKHETLKDRVFKVDKLVLKDVPVPPLFRLSALPGLRLVSAAGRAALEKAGIRGVAFESLSQVI
jgi:hypothetical protein